ncbi:MAG: cysteine hydrolase [Verrucomicrobiota bacterium]
MVSDLEWPISQQLDLEATALLAIDMQIDFLGKGGWFDRIGVDVAPTRVAIEPLGKLLEYCRSNSIRVIHTREAYRPCGGDVSENIKWRTSHSGFAYGDPTPCGRVLTRGEGGWEIIPELAPLENEWVIDKPAKSAFWGTDLEYGLRTLGIQNLIICGVTTDVCTQSTLRDAADLGFDCILASDAAAASKTENHDAYIKLLSSPSSGVAPIKKVDEIIERLEGLSG